MTLSSSKGQRPICRKAFTLSLSMGINIPMNKPWYVYIAKARTGRYYVGITTNPLERIKKHNFGNGSKFALNQGPFILVYVSDAYKTKSLARLREVQLKGWSQAKKNNLISGKWK